MIRFHHVGNYAPGEVTTRFVPGSRLQLLEVEAEIERLWQERVGNTGLHLFDGPMCRLEAFHVARSPGGSAYLRLELSLTSYKIFLGTNLYGRGDLPKESLANPLGVSPALETADGFLLFGRRNARVAYYPHRLHPFSGALEPPPERQEALDLFAECRRELAEELSLSADDVPYITLLGIVEDEEIRHPELILHARTKLGRDAVLSRLDPAEHADALAVPAQRAAVAAAAENPDFTPVGRATLELWHRYAEPRER